MKSYIVFDENDIWNTKRIEFKENCIDNEDKVLINKVVDKFSDYSATDMVELTQHQTSLIDAISSQNNEITNESILEFFNSID